MSNTWSLLSYDGFKALNNQKKIMENSTSTYDYGCAMIYFNMPEMSEIHSKIEDRDIYTEEGDSSYGLEDEPHVTLLYGIHSNDVKDEDVIRILDKYKDKIVGLKLDKISTFNNPKFEVLKFDVDSDILHQINKELCDKLPYTNNYPDYHPHLTIAYLKPKMGQKYIDMLKNLSYDVPPLKFVYSKPSGEKINHPL